MFCQTGKKIFFNTPVLLILKYIKNYNFALQNFKDSKITFNRRIQMISTLVYQKVIQQKFSE